MRDEIKDEKGERERERGHRGTRKTENREESFSLSE